MGFTDRQAQILDLAAQGHSDKEVARKLGLSIHTVRSHLQRLYSSENLSNRAEAVAAFISRREAAAAAEQRETEASEAEPRPLARRPTRDWLLVAAALAMIGAAIWGAAFTRGMQPVASAAVAPPAAPASNPASGPSPRPQPAAAGDQASPSASPPAARAVAPSPLPTSPIQTLAGSGQLALINQERAQAGLPPLAWNGCLANVAEAQARRLAAQGYVSSADGVQQDAGCALGLTPPAEALGYWPGVSDAQVNSLMLANPAQKAALLGPHRYLGAFWAVGPTGVAFLALEFV